jgi:hypothetical protein
MFLLSFTSLMMLCYYLNVKPYKDPFQLKIECMNEGFLWILSYFTPVFSHFVNTSWVRFGAGWIFVGACALLVLMNMTFVMVNIMKIAILKYKRRRFMKYHGLKELPKTKLEPMIKEEPELKAEEVVFPERTVPKVTFQRAFKKALRKKMR